MVSLRVAREEMQHIFWKKKKKKKTRSISLF